ncbi:hypothetical protein ACP4OV_008710 [Aristida adscensionis]
MIINGHGSVGHGIPLMGEETADDTHNKKDELPAEGLKLDISDSFLSYTKLMLAWHKSDAADETYNISSKLEELKTAQSRLTTTNKSKTTPAVLPLLSHCIANKKFILVCQRLAIEVKSLLKSFSADKPRTGKSPYWKFGNSKDEDCFPESKFIFLEIEKGMLEKSLAKLLYTNPALLSVVHLARGGFDDLLMYQGGTHAHIPVNYHV